jgi:hypothetical protein
MDQETIEAAPSADNGNVPAETVAPVAPSEPAETEIPAEQGTETTPAPEPELIELPDGRKVDAATVAQEYRNLLTDYTQKSQELARLTKNPGILPTDNQPVNPLADPNYVPQTYAELEEQIHASWEAKQIAKEEQRIAQTSALENAVTSQLTEIKQVDPALNETALFQHAMKYGFRDLKLAHSNMRDMSETIKKVQTTTAQNIAKRADPVSSSPGATGARLDPSQFATSIEYLRAIKGQ